MKRYTHKLALTITSIIFIAALPSFGAPAGKNVILFSWDGVQRAHLKECLAANQLPNLAALIKEGKMVDITVSGHKTDTKAGHSEMLTGYGPEVTGVYSNAKFKPIPAGYSVFERLETALGADNIKTVMLTSKTHHIGNCGPKAAVKPKTLDPGDPINPDFNEPKIKDETTTNIDAASTNASASAATAAAKPARKRLKQARAKRKALAQNTVRANQFGEPWYLVYKNIDVWDGEKQRDASVTGPIALDYLDKYSKDRFFMFIHFSDPDHQGHKFGENSKEVTDSYIECDKWLGKVVQKLKDLKLYDNTIVMVNSDHGFDEGKRSHQNAPLVFHAANTKDIVRDGKQQDIVPTILTEMGVDYSKMIPAYPGSSLTKAATTETKANN